MTVSDAGEPSEVGGPSILRSSFGRFLRSGDMAVLSTDISGSDWEAESREWIGSFLSGSRKSFIDVGSGTGWFSIPAALSGHRVLAVDAVPRIINRLYENIALNGLTGQIEVIVARVSDRICGSVSGDHFTASVDLDTLAMGHVDLVRIDVGSETRAVLDGAFEMIRRCRPAFIITATGQSHREALCDYLSAIGYSCRSVDRRNFVFQSIL